MPLTSQAVHFLGYCFIMKTLDNYETSKRSFLYVYACVFLKFILDSDYKT